ncbi:hypothetical protein BDR03DRAFT_1004486 [Suillus americanus]|nr:hypothetical protein BDR03DRAFT_1004486 [Suillus americanus]
MIEGPRDSHTNPLKAVPTTPYRVAKVHLCYEQARGYLMGWDGEARCLIQLTFSYSWPQHPPSSSSSTKYQCPTCILLATECMPRMPLGRVSIRFPGPSVFALECTMESWEMDDRGQSSDGSPLITNGHVMTVRDCTICFPREHALSLKLAESCLSPTLGIAYVSLPPTSFCSPPRVSTEIWTGYQKVQDPATGTSDSCHAEGQQRVKLHPPIPHNLRTRIGSLRGADMKHEFVDDVMKEEIGQLLVRDCPWSDNRLIDKADGFISPIRRDRMIENWIADGILQMTPSGAYQWGQPSKALIPLQREHWVKLPGTPFYLSHEALLSNFFNEVKELSRKFKNSVTRGAAVVGNQCMWEAFSRDLVKGARSLDIVLISDSLEKVRWSQVISAMEVKWKDSPELFRSALDQLGDKAAIVFHHQPQRQWFPSLSLCGTALHMSVFTRGGSIHSLPLDVGSDPKMFLKVMNYFTKSELSWLGYDTYIFRHPTLQIWDDKPYWLDDDDDEETEGEEFSLVGNLYQSIGLYGKGTRVFAVKHRLDQTHLVIKDCWDPSETMSDHMIHKKLQDPARDPRVRLTPNKDWSLLKIPEEEDRGDRLDRECAEKLDGVYCHVRDLYWDKINSLPGITIMKDHMRPSFGLLSKSPLSRMSVTSIGAAMIPAEDLAKIFRASSKDRQLEERH